jgi:hypothetical protein
MRVSDAQDELERLGLVPTMPAYTVRKGAYVNPDEVTLRTATGVSMGSVIPALDRRIPAVVVPSLRSGAGLGLHIACDPHDPSDQKVLLDPDANGDRSIELDLRQVDKAQIHAVWQAAKNADYEGEFMAQGFKPEEAKRMVASLVTQALAAAQHDAPPAEPAASTWSPPPVPAAPAARGAALPSYLGGRAPAVARPQAVAAVARPAEPTVAVAFAIPGFGTHVANYHEVIVSEEGNVMALCYDRRYTGNKFFPANTMQALDETAAPTTISARVGDAPVVYHLLVPQITLMSQDKELYIVMIQDQEPLA